jgi:hypothetical protein
VGYNRVNYVTPPPLSILLRSPEIRPASAATLRMLMPSAASTPNPRDPLRMATGMLISQLIMAVDRQYNCLLIPCHNTAYNLNDGFNTSVDEWMHRPCHTDIYGYHTVGCLKKSNTKTGVNECSHSKSTGSWEVALCREFFIYLPLF